MRATRASSPSTVKRSIAVAAVVTAPLLLLVVACSGDDDKKSAAADTTNACADLARLCHPWDKGSGLPHDCHELGHTGDDNACAPRKAECLAVCPPIEAGGGNAIDFDASPDVAAPDAGGADAAPDGGDFCTPWCECLTATCSTENGYPFTSTADCVSKCPVLTDAEKDCLPKWCEQAKGLANKTHTCEHAWGLYGTDECETLP